MIPLRLPSLPEVQNYSGYIVLASTVRKVQGLRNEHLRIFDPDNDGRRSP